MRLVYPEASLIVAYLAASPLLFGFAKSLYAVLMRLPGKTIRLEPPDDLLYRFNEVRTKFEAGDLELVYLKALDPTRPVSFPVFAARGRVGVREEVWPSLPEAEQVFALSWCCLQAKLIVKRQRSIGGMTWWLLFLSAAGAFHPILGIVLVTAAYRPVIRRKGTLVDFNREALRACEECGSPEAALAYISRLPKTAISFYAGKAIRRKYGLPDVLGSVSPQKSQSFNAFGAWLSAASFGILYWFIVTALVWLRVETEMTWRKLNESVAFLTVAWFCCQWLAWRLRSKQAKPAGDSDLETSGTGDSP